jgi:acyl-coenzyme A thioesterase PaaI-like protein
MPPIHYRIEVQPDMDQKKKYTELPYMETHKCFGCGPANASGLRMKFFTDGERVFSWLTVPDHLCGWKNLVHGGVISTILDEVMGRSVIYFLRCLGLTKSIAVDFLHPVIIGDKLRVEGRVLEAQNERQARAEGLLFNNEGVMCARGKGVFGLYSPEFLRKKGVAEEETLLWFETFFKE